jgi:hypothetical protein
VPLTRKHQDATARQVNRDSDGDPGSAGGEQSVADQASLGVGERGDGDPDGDLGRDDDPSGGSDSGGPFLLNIEDGIQALAANDAVSASLSAAGAANAGSVNLVGFAE